MNPVMIVTDSSAYLPDEIITGYPVRIATLTVNWDGKSYHDGVDIKAAEFYTRLAVSDSLPTTSQVSSSQFESLFDELLADGYDVLALPISSGISGSYQSAAVLLNRYPAERLVLLDTKLVSMALGFQVLAAAGVAASGGSLTECKQAALRAYDQIGVYFTVNTLKYLAAGGRINSAKRLLGSALDIKPILEIRDGKIELVSSVISRRKAIERMLALVEKDIAGRTPVRISVFHAMALEAAQELLETTQARFSPVENILAEVSPVIGSHTGPGTLAIAYRVGE